MVDRKRMTAVKSNIYEIINGQYIQQEGFNPNYVLTPQGESLSRVRIMATVVQKFVSEDGGFGSITIDDGTETIRAKVFKSTSMLDGIEEGNVVDLIGKIREYNGEIHLVPESIYEIDNPNFLTLRQAELKKQKKENEKIKNLILEKEKETADLDELKKIMQEKHHISPEKVEAVISSQELGQQPKEDRTEIKKKILELIDEIDEGDGADYVVLMERSELKESEIDPIINDLLTEGTCFEPKPGKIKKI